MNYEQFPPSMRQAIEIQQAEGPNPVLIDLFKKQVKKSEESLSNENPMGKIRTLAAKMEKSEGYSYEEKDQEYDVFCKHMGHLVNQGITLCNAGHDPSKCDTCEFREPDTIKFKTKSCSIG